MKKARSTLLLPEMFPEKWRTRFMSHIAKKGADDCWEWTAMRDKAGYGMSMTPFRTPKGAHRIAFVIGRNESLSAGLLVCHKCDNPPCCNPSHLFAGTDQDNHTDRGRKGRTRAGVGERQWKAKLTEEKVREIRVIYRPRKRGQRGPRCQYGPSLSAVAKMFGVTDGTIHSIVKGKTWTHVK